MPKSLQDIIARSEDLADAFERYQPHPGDERDPAAMRGLQAAVTNRTDAERKVVDAVREARHAGWSWAMIGLTLGTSGEAARQRYSKLAT